ncbi:ankyrin repeat domain-containing protein [Trinickia fusca]|uniref:Ankyrin repeat domain-containing protein n=1 Tax=Trinickia fusca TaxID=2419777 RepID=A0A494X865_9BURK|nr:ankyrin repeat domain-containing protein [Trinickia fusca]RKP46915.1 ankyrin repeat domain-containing protein [Trinickia fusca]
MKNRFRTTLARALAIARVTVFAVCAQTAPLTAVSHPGTYADPGRYDDAWFDAARLGRIDILQALVDAHYPIDTTTPEGYTAVILAAYRDQPATLDYLLRIGANPCIGDRHGNTALMGALFKGETAIAKRLADTHCQIDQTNHAGETALSFAALFGRLDMLSVLVAHGANPDHVDARGHTALQNAILQGNGAAVEALEKVGATPNADVSLRMRP